ncbi:MAG: hypothetical protein IKY72_08145 [Bacteroidaceae bacterium]|nr:hypothetical protein [Bacteroidaceae bacterium]
MVRQIFVKVAMALYRGAQRLGITYNEVNILVYYLLIPLTWTIMVDFLIGIPMTTSALLLVWTGIRIGTVGRFSEWCDWAFMRSVDLLNYFNRWGGNYVLNSVVICVVVPVFIYIALIVMLMTM